MSPSYAKTQFLGLFFLAEIPSQNTYFHSQSTRNKKSKKNSKPGFVFNTIYLCLYELTMGERDEGRPE